MSSIQFEEISKVIVELEWLEDNFYKTSDK